MTPPVAATSTSVAFAEPARDPCLAEPYATAPAPLAHAYTGLARAARCQAELSSIMDRVAKSLGVDCNYCHNVGDFSAPTPKKQIANYMALELVPRVAKRGSGAVWCDSCHVVDGKATAKILGEPRSESLALEWMNTHMVQDFTRTDGKPLRCKSCHRGNWGSPEFLRHVILSDALAGLPSTRTAGESAGVAPVNPRPQPVEAKP